MSRTKQTQAGSGSTPNARRLTGVELFSLAFGLFLGLAILKFGNPVILDSKIDPPRSLTEFWSYAWPPNWSVWFLMPLAIVALIVAFRGNIQRPVSKWLWILPLCWFAWQLISATRTVDSGLTQLTILHFSGLIACYFAGMVLIGTNRSQRLLLAGVLAGLVFSLVRAVDQRIVEFPTERKFLAESERAGWTNLPPEMVLDMKRSGAIISTNGVDITNPVLAKKYEKARVFGTFVYPNALAGAILLLLPVSLVFVVSGTRRFRAITRVVAIGLTAFLGVAPFFWSGSKSGWLIAMVLIGIWLFRLNWPVKWKWVSLALILMVGIGAFGIRFRSYFAAGATSVGARFDYWRAAGKTALRNPIFGTGPGTFQHPYETIKAPESEMARLVHNDYLEQFSDSGFPGGGLYAAWIAGLMVVIARSSRKADAVTYALALGCLGWFLQGLSEFGLYIPALAWTAFALAGSLVGGGNQIDKSMVAR